MWLSDGLFSAVRRLRGYVWGVKWFGDNVQMRTGGWCSRGCVGGGGLSEWPGVRSHAAGLHSCIYQCHSAVPVLTARYCVYYSSQQVCVPLLSTDTASVCYIARTTDPARQLVAGLSLLTTLTSCCCSLARASMLRDHQRYYWYRCERITSQQRPVLHSRVALLKSLPPV